MVYPTLTFLEEAGYVTAESEGAKKRYTITEEGRAYLEENRDIADMILARLAAIGSKMARARRAFGRDRDREEAQNVPSSSTPPSTIFARHGETAGDRGFRGRDTDRRNPGKSRAGHPERVAPTRSYKGRCPR